MHKARAFFLVMISLLLALSGCHEGCFGRRGITGPTPYAGSFDSGDLANGDIFVHRFNTLGSFKYRCRHHATMTAVINVTGAGEDSVTVPITDFVFGTPSAPPAVKAGGYVKWVNGGSVHTVTRP